MIKIVSGGQTGIDRGALDAALDSGVACGGWCPSGRLAEDGTIPGIYPLTELESREYRARTRENVVDSDTTVIFFFGELEGGTDLTLSFCKQYDKPHLTIDAEKINATTAAKLIHNFILRHRISTLNVAGPRASKVAAAHNYSKDAIAQLIKLFEKEESLPGKSI